MNEIEILTKKDDPYFSWADDGTLIPLTRDQRRVKQNRVMYDGFRFFINTEIVNTFPLHEQVNLLMTNSPVADQFSSIISYAKEQAQLLRDDIESLDNQSYSTRIDQILETVREMINECSLS